MPAYALAAIPLMINEGEPTISDILTNWTTLVNGVMGIVTGNVILFTMFGIALVGGAIGLVKRLV